MINVFLFKSFIPEVLFSLTFLIQIVFNTSLINSYKLNFPVINKEILSQIFFTFLCLIFCYFDLLIECVSENNIFLNSYNECNIKIIFILFCLFALVSIWRNFLIQKLNFFEYFILFLISILSSLLLLCCSDLISVYLTIELQALCFYILACFIRDSSFSTEAGLKYFVSGAFISGFYILGCSLLYGCLGTLNLNSLNILLTFELLNEFYWLNFFILIGVLLITITFLFKISAAPFHFWSPDVYEGAPLSSTVIFSILPKIAILTFLIKWFLSIGLIFVYIKLLLLVTGLISVFFGTFFAIQQKRLKKVIIYSSIAQVGFIVLGLTTNSIDGISSVYFFLFIYLITSVLIWTKITLLYSFQKQYNFFNKIDTDPLFLSNLTNFFETNKLWSFSFILIFFSLAGVPPLSGFLAKLFIIFSLIQNNDIFYSILLILISIVSVFYYIRIIKILFFEKSITINNNLKFQTVFQNIFLEFDSIVLSLGLTLLVYIYIFPNMLFLLSHYITVKNFFV